MSFWRRISPRGAISDFAHEWRRPNPYRWRVLGLSVATTFAMIVLLIPDTEYVPPARPEVTYITTFAPGRTDEEIAASNLANQARKDRLAEEAAARDEERRQRARALGEALGFDVDELERQYSDDPVPAASPSAQPSPAAGGQ